MKTIVIRVDASSQIGSGHVMRCMTLANELRKRGGEIYFVCREYPGNLISMLREAGFQVLALPVYEVSQFEDAMLTIKALNRRKPDWLVVDHYDLDFIWEALLRPQVGYILAIDDLANRKHECDLLLDQNDFINKEDRYHQFLPIWCTSKLGSRFFMLRPGFRTAGITQKRNGSKPERLFLYFGSGDLCDATSTAIDALLEFNPALHVDVVVGAANPHANKVADRCALLPNALLHRQTQQIENLMAGASLALGAGGITTYERIAVGLYAITVATAANQIEPLKYLATEGRLIYLGLAEQTSVTDWIRALSVWRTGVFPLAEITPIGSAMNRLVDLFFVEIRRFGSEHIDSTFGILADSEIRKAFAMTDEVTIERHRDYWSRKLTDVTEHVFALHYAGRHIGNLGLKPVDSKISDYEGWIYIASEAGRGLGEFAFRQLIKYAFSDLKLPRLVIHVLKDNKRAINLYAKIGFLSIPGPPDPIVWGSRAASIVKMELCA